MTGNYKNQFFSGIKYNDIVDGEGICVSVWVSGCPHRCPGCHNKELWDFNYGQKIPTDIKGQLIKAISANGIMRNFSVLGGEPLCDENIDFIEDILVAVRTAYPNITIYLWTGYTFEELKNKNNKQINHILSLINVLIDGRYIEELRDITLPLRGSSNQKIYRIGEI